ncbi:autotransporter domain-containing protein [Phenylobacterium sp.]|uniref:autotransporter domain-containing protein n=1 Tax=Phenylobacterium sp. TaxID=1871053 RepID=UPI002731B4E4|nr:autotransporter domain-containing protein [Phenylobacterium sp.]MDP1617932.1 autotransporter domain-containing protein [Phenylobacterium sp.]MDP1985999.1 autotransporter domain-containing protein [Phenylobacterium sp.]
MSAHLLSGVLPLATARHARISGASRLVLAALAGVALGLPATAAAAPLSNEVLSGDYIKIGLNDKGTLGVGGNTSPGVLYDGTGMGTFNPAYDYLTPGSPFEGFTISGVAGSAFTATNNNSNLGSANISGILTSYNGVAHDGTTSDNRAVWTGAFGGLFNITHDYAFNNDGQQLNIGTTIEALVDLTNLTFARFIDPDAVAAAGDSSATNNFRGATGVPESDLVYAEALASKYVIGLYTNDATTHNSAVTSWTPATAPYLAGTNVGNGDNTIGLGFDIGTLLSGSSITLTYRYIFGTDIAAAVQASSGGGAQTAQPPPPPPTIDTSASYSVDQLKTGEVIPVFDGGALTLGSTGATDIDFTILAAGGTIDTAGHDLTLSGAVTGVGQLTKTGRGVLTLTGENTYAGIRLAGGVLAFNHVGALGGAGSHISISEGAQLRTLGDVTVGQSLNIGAGQGGGIDTGDHQMRLNGDITGGGAVQKLGAGVLTLSGVNDHGLLDIQQGRVVVENQQALGASGGVILLQTGGSFAVGGDFAMDQSVVVNGANSQFDTGGHTVNLTGAIAGNACFTKVGLGHLNLLAAGANAIGACVEEGRLSFNNLFAGNVWVEAGGEMGGSGSIAGDVVANGVIAPGNSPGRLVIAGSLTQAAGSTLALDIDGRTAGIGAGHYDTLVLTGAGGVYTAGGTIAPITRGITGAATNSFTPSIGDAFQVITAQGGVIGAYEAIVQPANGMPANARFEVVYQPDAVILVVTPDRYAVLAGRANGQAVGAALDTVRPAAHERAQAAPFTRSLAGLNVDQTALTLHQVSGEIHAATLDTMLQSQRAARAPLHARITDGFDTDQRVWGRVNVETWDVEADAWALGYDSERTHVAVGADRRLGDRLLVGAAVGYSETDVDAAAMGAATTFSHQGLVYAGWRQGPHYIDGAVSVSRDSYKTTRTLALPAGPQTVFAKPQGEAYGVDLEAGRELGFRALDVTLAAGLAADRIERDAVVEQGSALTALDLSAATREAVQGRVGVRVSRQTPWGGLTLKPQASAFVLQEFADVEGRSEASLDGATFTSRAASPGRTSLRLSAGVEAMAGANTRLSFNYRYGASDQSESHALAATASIAW